MHTTAPNPALQAQLDLYASIYEDFLRPLRAAGVAFAEPHADDAEVAALRERLAAKGATLRNGGASVSVGPLSTACVACTGGAGSETFYYSLKCHRNCYFCFNPNQERWSEDRTRDRDWRSELQALAERGRQMTHLALTGGEPLLRPDEACAFFSTARALWPQAHLRLYTSGDQLDEALTDRLAAAGLNELRVSLKPDDTPAQWDAQVGHVGQAAQRGLAAMVEMPALPGDDARMQRLLLDLDAAGAWGINLLEFCFPLHNWPEFARRGFTVRNPPFKVLYDYEYAGALPIAGSEATCLRLAEFALDRGLRLGVHYCSLENKHRDQVFQQNHRATLADPCYALDGEDFFWKTVKLFGRDVAPARSLLGRRAPRGGAGATTGGAAALDERAWRYDPEDDCLLVNPRLRGLLDRLPVTPVVSYNILEHREGGLILRELGLFEE